MNEECVTWFNKPLLLPRFISPISVGFGSLLWKVSNADMYQICLLLSATWNATIFYFPGFYPCDLPYVTDELRQAESFKKSCEKMKTELDNLQKDMYRSVPFFSTRYKVGFKDWPRKRLRVSRVLNAFAVAIAIVVSQESKHYLQTDLHFKSCSVCYATICAEFQADCISVNNPALKKEPQRNPK